MLSGKAAGFFDSMTNAVIFVPLRGTKYALRAAHALRGKAQRGI